MTGTGSPVPTTKTPVFQWWMAANLAVGMGQFAFIPMLVVPYVIEVTGKPSAGGTVLAVIGLAAISAPALGTFADRYRAHRMVFTLGLLATGISYLLYAWSALSQTEYSLVAIIFGVGIAAIQSIGPAFIVSIGIDKPLQAKRLAAYNLLTSAGLLLAGLLLAAIAPWAYPQKFMLAALIIMALTAMVWFATAGPAKQIRPREPDDEVASGAAAGPRQSALSQVLRTRFGVMLLMLIFTGIGYNAFIGQVSNIMGQTFAFSSATTSLLLGVSGLINMAGFIVAGWWMARVSALRVVTGAQLTHLVGLLGLGVLSLVSPAAAVAAGASMLCFYAAEPFGRIPQPVLAVQFSTLNASTATSWYIAFLAGSASIGGLLAGALAQAFGYDAILWLAVAAFTIGILINFFGLWPADADVRRRAFRPAAESFRI